MKVMQDVQVKEALMQGIGELMLHTSSLSASKNISNSQIFLMELLQDWNRRTHATDIQFQMLNCNPVGIPTEIGLKLSRDPDGVRVDTTFYKHIVGSLMYLTLTRPDIMYVVSLIRRYMENPTQLHLRAAKIIFRYLKGILIWGYFIKGEKSQVSLVLLTVIMQVILLIEKALLGMCSR